MAFFTLQRRAPPSSAWTRLGCVYSLLLRPGGAAGYHERPRRPSCERQGPGVRAQLRAAVSQARPRAETAASVLSRHKQLPAFRCDTAAAGVEHAAQTPPRAAQSHAYGVPMAFFGVGLRRRVPGPLGCVSLTTRAWRCFRISRAASAKPRRPSCERQGPGVRAQLRAAVSQARPRAETAASVLPVYSRRTPELAPMSRRGGCESRVMSLGGSSMQCMVGGERGEVGNFVRRCGIASRAAEEHV